MCWPSGPLDYWQSATWEGTRVNSHALSQVLPRYLQYEIVFSADQTSTLVARLMAALGKVASHPASVTNSMAA